MSARLGALALGLVALATAGPGGGDEPRLGDAEIAAKLHAQPTEVLAPGQRGELSVVILEAPDPQLPVELRLSSQDLAFGEDRLGWSAVVDARALQPRLRGTFVAPQQPGRYVAEGWVQYSVCRGDWCRLKTGSVRWTVLVEATSVQTAEP